jgi:antitoxin YqcF
MTPKASPSIFFGARIDRAEELHRTRRLGYLTIRCSRQEFPTRLELAGVYATADQFFTSILASAAFCIIRTQGLYSPGSVMPGYVREYYPSTTVPHLYFTAPFLWEDALNTLNLAIKRVDWLLVMPISDAENDYLKMHGEEGLEDLFKKCQIDIFDLTRPSVA